MRDKVIRTPLPPFKTFDDDPLRVLRLIRFSGKLDFEVVPEVKEAMQHPDIKVGHFSPGIGYHTLFSR
jgi:tRNA nucleotidyltransferase (CCA-adding enzyme)